MKTLPLRWFFLAIAIATSGCTTVFAPAEGLTIKAIVTEELINELGSFTNACYVDNRVLVRVIEPSTMKDEVLAISLADGWMPHVREHYGTELWDKAKGSIVEFHVKSRDLKKGWPSAPRRINADRIGTIVWIHGAAESATGPNSASLPSAP